jgi:hypothetical protein
MKIVTNDLRMKSLNFPKICLRVEILTCFELVYWMDSWPNQTYGDRNILGILLKTFNCVAFAT